MVLCAFGVEGTLITVSGWSGILSPEWPKRNGRFLAEARRDVEKQKHLLPTRSRLPVDAPTAVRFVFPAQNP